MKHLFAILAAATFLVVPVAMAQSDGDEKTIEERREEARVERLWNLNWRQFTPYFIVHEGEFICVPGYDRNNPSSAGQSISEYRSESAWQQEYRDERGKDQSRKLTKPEADAFAAVALIPKVEVGQYGYILSGNIEEIVDDSTVELEDIWLVDADAVREEKQELKEKLWGRVLEDIEDAIRDRGRGKAGKQGRSSRRMAENEAIDWGFKAREEAMQRQRDSAFTRYTWVVKGYATGSLKENARWPSTSTKQPGLQLVVVEVEDRTVTAVPVESLRKGIEELQFIDYLQSRDLNKAAFVEIVNDAKREHRNDYVVHVLAQITGKVAPAQPDDVNDEVRLAD